MKRFVWIVVVALLGLGLTVSLKKQERSNQTSSEALSLGKTRADTSEFTGELADGLTISPWASAPMLASPVALALDDQGRAYVTHTTRRKTSNLDIRQHTDWMAYDLSLESIEDKRAFYHKMLDASRSEENDWLTDRNEDGVRDWRDLAVEQEKIHRLVDTDQDGQADQSTVFVDGFATSEVTGVAAGVLPFGGDVYATVAPHLWRLRDTDGNGKVDWKRPLVEGFGVHMSYAGHDMSGLTMGPDGRLYWSIGDIGLNVEGPGGRQWKYPHEGAVLRAEPDGSNFEVFARGLRNPQEIAFDKYGNLISVDNDGDRAGEHERIVYITEDSDTGWRTHWQFGKYGEGNNYNVWMEEGLHRPHFEGQPAYITPAVALYYDGPAGFAYNPGTALSEKWRNHFFVTSFTGSAAQATIRAFTLKQKGASFELARDEQVLQGILTTSIDFGPDGALYLADWISGWNAGDQGRIWRMGTEGAPSTLRRETQRLLQEGMGGRTVAALGRLLRHQDMRVRKQAQFELVGRGEEGADRLLTAARSANELVARLHGIWGIGQLGREDAGSVAPLVDLLGDGAAKVRAQAAKVIGEAGYEPAVEALLPLLDDSSERVQFHAALALSKLNDERALDPAVEMIAEKGSDPYLRHAGATVLAEVADAGFLRSLADHPSKQVRLAAVVALRRMQDPAVQAFLQDESEQVVTEAARAIHDDTSINETLPALARVLEREGLSSEALLRRAVNANLRLGTPEGARRLARYAVRPEAPKALRVEALNSLGLWPDPPVLDRVEGRYRQLKGRDPDAARPAFASNAAALWEAGVADTVQVAAARTAARLGYSEAGSTLHDIAVDESRPAGVRVAALQALGTLGSRRLVDAVEVALEAENPSLRREAQGLITEIDVSGEKAVELLQTVLETGTPAEKQTALETLGAMEGAASQEVLSEWMDRLLAGNVDPGLQLDLIQAAEQSSRPEVAKKLEQYRAAKPEGDLLAAYREALEGGTAEAGRRIVFDHPTAQCIRCHQVDGEGGKVGPPLTGIGGRKSAAYLLESLVDPSAELTPGYGTVSLTLENGDTVAGTFQKETDDHIVVEIGDGETTTVDKERIAERSTAPSAMPSMQHILDKSEIRNVIAYLETLK